MYSALPCHVSMTNYIHVHVVVQHGIRFFLDGEGETDLPYSPTENPWILVVLACVCVCV